MTDIALAQVHLPSGSATIQGIVRHADGGPIVVGSLLRHRPVSTGGSEVLFPALMSTAETLDRSDWALTDPTVVEVELRNRGWEIIRRDEAAALLTRQGYRMRTSTQPGHVLHTDQADAAIWHPSGGPIDGSEGDTDHDPHGPGPHVRLAFAVRPIVVPDTPAVLSGQTGS